MEDIWIKGEDYIALKWDKPKSQSNNKVFGISCRIKGLSSWHEYDEDVLRWLFKKLEK